MWKDFDTNRNGTLSFSEISKGIIKFYKIEDVVNCKIPLFKAYTYLKYHIKKEH